MQRLFLIYNPRSSRYAEVKRDVLDQIHDLKGYIIGKYEVQPTNLDDNITQFSKILKDGDLVISAGGDATGVIAVNSILKSGKDATLAALPYGNFNDLSRTLGTKTLNDIFSRTRQAHLFYPLEICVDGKFFRYATCYVTIGMTAEAVHIYDLPGMRKKLKKGFGRSISSYTELAGWYFKHRHKKQFIPDFTLNGQPQPPKSSDYAAVNGSSMARVMKGGKDCFKPKVFRSEVDRLTSFYRLAKLMIRSIFHRIPGSNTAGDTIEFAKPATITLQAEGEHQTFKNIQKIEIKKGTTCLKVITN